MEYVYDLKWKYDVLTADPTAEDWASGFQQLGTGAAAMYIAANDAVAQPTQVMDCQQRNWQWEQFQPDQTAISIH